MVILEMSRTDRATALYRDLKTFKIEYPLNRQQKFLPLSILDSLITEEIVRLVLYGKIKFLFDRKLSRRIMRQEKKIFAILVEIGESDVIKALDSEGLADEHLPLFPNPANASILVGRQGKEFYSFAKRMNEQRIADFLEKQWIVLAPVFDSSGQHMELDPRCPLPFLEMDPAGGGHASTIYRSELHQAHFEGPGLEGQSYQIAVKEFRDEGVFRQERTNLETVKRLNHEHLIKHFATYKKDTLHYAVFPWANGGSLRDFWDRHDKRIRDTTLTLWSLQQMLGLAEALKALHSVNCRHGDLKPENILHFHDETGGKLIVADVGVSRTHQQDTQFRNIGTTTRATTPSYEAPEAFTNHSAPRARRYDIWSIGCIFLEFAIWLLHDLEAISTFGASRNAPSFEFYLIDGPSSSSKRFPKIHPMVTCAVENLRQDPRCSGDTIFGAFIDFITSDLLQVEVDRRASAEVLVDRLRDTVQDAEADPTHLFNNVASAPEKLRFLRRTQTGINSNL